MYANLSEIDPDIITDIKSNYEKVPFKELKKRYELTRQEILSILGNQAEVKDLIGYTIPHEKVIFISDTHLGSSFENLHYLNYVYRFAENHKVKHVVHCGDIIHGNKSPLKSMYKRPLAQLEHVIKDYPSCEGTMTHILFGNHDYDAFKDDDSYYKIIKSRPDFNPLGFRRAYLKWGKMLISLKHHIEDYHLAIPDICTDLNICGHGHICYYEKNNLHLPTCSVDLKTRKRYLGQPGFIYATNTDDKVKFYFFTFGPNILKAFKALDAEEFVSTGLQKLENGAATTNHGCILTMKKENEHAGNIINK